MTKKHEQEEAASVKPVANCVVDRNVLNADTFSDFSNIGLSVFAPLCGKNRGVFVLNPTDGSTWGCAAFPPSFGERANVQPTIADSNAIQLQYAGGNITAQEAVDLVDLFVQSVFFSTPSVDKDPEACDVGGLTTLSCETSGRKIITTDQQVIRAVTLAGVLVPEPWATAGKLLTAKQARTFYTDRDFADMQALGLNTVQIPVPLAIFDKKAGHHGKHADEILLLGELLQMAKKSGLGAILDLVDGSDVKTKEREHAVKKAAEYAAGTSNVIALSLPSPLDVAAARKESTKLPLLLPHVASDLIHLHSDDPYVFAALSLEHTSSVADVASSDGPSDRLKMFYHESIACSARSSIEYVACYRDVPVYISSGFDVSIDDCVNSEDAAKFHDYGQCGRLQESADSHWWFDHRSSLLARQLAVFEKGLGWNYPAWKIHDDQADKEGLGILDTPAKLKSLKHVAAAGIFPSLTAGRKQPPAQLACLNPPAADFVLGDDTVSPTASPPPACDGGWWDPAEKKCAYWVPPVPTVSPTSSPSASPVACPVCEDAPLCPGHLTKVPSLPKVANVQTSDVAGASLMMTAAGAAGQGSPHAAFLGGMMATLVVGAIMVKLVAVLHKKRTTRSRSEYKAVPNAELSV
jgi:hypothetical protein